MPSLGRQAGNAHIPDLMATTRTSENSPLRIDHVTAAGRDGQIGMTICPGKRGDSQYGNSWERDLTTDLNAIRQWGAKILVTLMEPDEMERLGVAGLEQAATSNGFQWFHIPITDGEIPDERFESAWPAMAPHLIQQLKAGHKVVIHCRGGLGRTGMIACLLLIELGKTSTNALKMVRSARPGTVETPEQEDYVLSYQPRF